MVAKLRWKKIGCFQLKKEADAHFAKEETPLLLREETCSGGICLKDEVAPIAVSRRVFSAQNVTCEK